MKLAILLSSFLLFSFTGFCQRFTVNIASETGQKFTLYINNQVQNRKPLPAVNVMTASEKPRVKIIFTDKKLAPLVQSIDLDEEATAFTIYNRNGRWFLRKNAPFRPGDEMDDRIDRNRPGNDWPRQDDNRRDDNRRDDNRRDDNRQENNNYLENGSMCNSSTIDDIAFIKLKKEVSDAYYDTRKAAVVKRILETNCMMASQVAALIKMLANFTSDQLEMAKLGYLHMYDTENFDEVIDAVASLTHKKELEQFAANTKRPSNRPGGPDRPGHNQHPRPNPGNGSSDCQGGRLSNSQFAEALQTVKSATFEHTKMEQAKLIAKNGCLSVSQIREIIRTFDFEATKLNFAKFAYDRTYETHVYYLVNQEFDFEASKTELTNYINQQQ